MLHALILVGSLVGMLYEVRRARGGRHLLGFTFWGLAGFALSAGTSLAFRGQESLESAGYFLTFLFWIIAVGSFVKRSYLRNGEA